MDRETRYYYDEETCSFVEVERDWTDTLQTVATIVGLAIVLAVAAAWVIDAHLIVTPHEQTLQAKNEALRKQLQRADEKMGTLASKLDRLSQKDRTMYRKLLQIEPISDDVRQVGVGGSDLHEEFDHLGGQTGDLLRETSTQIDKLERQVSLQGASYRELESVISQRRDEFDQLPAIRPSNGRIVSGYGMRHHPILNVRKMHAGVDFLLRTGTPVMASADGIIRRAQYSPTYGNYVDIYHEESGYMTRYAHLSEFADGIDRGVRVKRGQEIDGYDGAYVSNDQTLETGFEHESWVAFDPEQIKSAVGNRGTFDPASADIRFHRVPSSISHSASTSIVRRP